jgi:hypothetical protein
MDEEQGLEHHTLPRTSSESHDSSMTRSINISVAFLASGFRRQDVPGPRICKVVLNSSILSSGVLSTINFNLISLKGPTMDPPRHRPIVA